MFFAVDTVILADSSVRTRSAVKILLTFPLCRWLTTSLIVGFWCESAGTVLKKLRTYEARTVAYKRLIPHLGPRTEAFNLERPQIQIKSTAIFQKLWDCKQGGLFLTKLLV